MPTEADSSHLARRLSLISVIGIFLLLFGFGSTSASANLIATPWDKLVHFAVFLVLTVGLRILLPRQPITVIIGLALGVAVADEFHQFFVPDRQPGWDDGFADMAGVACGLFIRPLLARTFSKFALCQS
jgi:VanZ family protein